ncbi:MAG TPA: uracil-DNA glycosylase family protein [Azonexus sp.]|nr:uracil-DNA glycosylase family protein [Azonexus sp.]
MNPMTPLPDLLEEIHRCQLCAEHLPLGARPVLQAAPGAKILVACQAPGRKVHATGIPFDDASGARLREWLGVSPETFYDPARIAILPMGFCYPGTGRSGDLPPRPVCATTWQQPLLTHLKDIELTLVIGQYALAYHLPGKGSLTEAVRHWRDAWPEILPLPHPSPRNNIWLKRNPWFAQEVLPTLRQRVAELLA